MPTTRTQVAARIRSSGLRTSTIRPRFGGVRSWQDLAWLRSDWRPSDEAPPPVTEGEALAFPPFGRGLELITAGIADTAWRAVRWNPEHGVHERLAEQPAVLTDPDPLADVWQYKFAAIEDLVLHGNHFALPGETDPQTDRPGWLVPVPTDQVWVVVNEDAGLWTWAVGGVEYGLGELFHVSAGSRSGEVLGRGVLRRYREWLGGAVAAEKHSAGYFNGGGLPPGVISSEQLLTQEQGDELKGKWRTMMRTREPVVLPRHITVTPLVTDADKQQLVQARQWNVTVTAMMLGIPAVKLNIQGPSMTYQNVEQVDIDWTRDTLSRWASPLSAAFTKWLLPEHEQVLWDWAGRGRADTKTTTDTLAVQVDKQLATVDEARAALGRPPVAVSTQPGQTPAGVPALTHQEVF